MSAPGPDRSPDVASTSLHPVVVPARSDRIVRLRDVLRERARDETLPLAHRRADFEAVMSSMPFEESASVRAGEVGGIGGEWIEPTVVTPGRLLVYLHGGGYMMGSCATARRLAARIAVHSRATAFSVEYRLAPEHPFPAAVDDALAVYRDLLARGQPARSIVIAGDSAGGGLAVATALAARDAGLPAAAGLVLLSPWTDLTVAGRSVDDNRPSDPLVSREALVEMAHHYLGGAAVHPLASPAAAPLGGLPAMLVQAGDAEVLRDDAVAFATTAAAARVDITLELYEEMIHVWQSFFPRLPEANVAIERMATWLERRWGAGAGTPASSGPPA